MKGTLGLEHYKRETGVAMWVWFLAALCELERRVRVGELLSSSSPWFSAPAIMHAALELSHGLTTTERRHIKDQLVGLAACGFVQQHHVDGLNLWRITEEGRARTRHIVDAVVALTSVVGGASA